MRHFSTLELTKNIAAVTDAAIKEPVAITKHRKTKFILMAKEDFDRMRKAADPRRVYGPGETPPELAKMIVEHLDKIIAEGEAAGEE